MYCFINSKEKDFKSNNSTRDKVITYDKKVQIAIKKKF